MVAIAISINTDGTTINALNKYKRGTTTLTGSRAISRYNSCNAMNSTQTMVLPDVILGELMSYFTVDELLVLEQVDPVWSHVIIASGGWRRVVLRNEQDLVRNHLLLQQIAVRHGSHVQQLEVINCAVENSVFIKIGPCFTKLTALMVSGCKMLEDSGFIAMISASTQSITHVRAVKCPMLTDASLAAINKNHHHVLEHVDVSHCRLLSSNGVISLVEKASRLHSIGLKGCPKVNDSAVISIAAHCPHLRCLLLGGSGHVTDESLIALAQYCHGLEVLDIGRSNPFGLSPGGVSDRGVLQLVAANRQLQHLVLRGQGQLSPVVLAALAVQCRQLHTLDIGGCRAMVQDSAIVCSLVKQMTQLEQLSVSFCGEHSIETNYITSITTECRQLKRFDVDGEHVIGTLP